MKASINKKTCMFCGMCGGLCPEVFRADTDRRSVAFDTEISEELLATVRHAESICPTWSISLQESTCVNQ
jgi:ferredoxin